VNAGELAQLFRLEVQDRVAPYLWDDIEVIRFVDEAQRMFCRLTDGLSDSRTPEVCNIAVTPSTEWYPLDPRVLKIRSAVRSSGTNVGRAVELVTVEQAEANGIRFDGRAGPLSHFITNMSEDSLRAWPVPNETATVTMTVFRLPLQAVEDSDADLEIDQQHHYSLLNWMKALAYSKNDAETYDRGKAVEHDARFRAYCAQVQREQSRRRRVTQSVSYGGL
jgi:hypothetical protein